MRPVTHDYQSLNEYTFPLQGKPYYRSSGIIYAVDRSGNKYAVGQVDLERFDDQNFQYVFTPEWSVIDTLPSSIFQGIPGLDMSMRLERYYRVNMTPYFISERTPAKVEKISGNSLKQLVWITMTALSGCSGRICAVVPIT